MVVAHPVDNDRGMPADPSTSPTRRPWTLGRVLAWGVALSVVGVWGYVMFLSFFVGRAEPRDRLEDDGFVEAAEATCAPTAAAVAALPFASELDGPSERADQLDDATARLEDMVRALRDVPPPAADDEALAVERWLADWEEYNRNRRSYADRFRGGEDEPFRVTDRDGEQIDTAIDEFAHINYMESCETPDDVG